MPKLLSMIFALLICVNSLAADVTAQECESVDLKNRMNPPRNQGGSEFCYAFTAADLLAYKIGIKPPAELSTLNMISHYISMSPEEVAEAKSKIVKTKPPEGAKFWAGDPYNRDYDFYQKPLGLRNGSGGYIDLMLAEYSDEKSLCLESDVPSEVSGKAYNDPDELVFLDRQITLLAGDFYSELEMKEYHENELHPGCHSGQPTIDQLKLTSSALNDLAARKVREDLDGKCKHRISNNKYVVHSTELLKPLVADKDVFGLEKAHTLLALIKRNQPVGIGYDPSAVYDHYPGGSHASIIIGKRWNGRACEVEIRNSYGAKCDGKRANVKCENGYWWIDIKQLAPALTQAVWVE